jgi:hypothetical protein
MVDRGAAVIDRSICGCARTGSRARHRPGAGDRWSWWSSPQVQLVVFRRPSPSVTLVAVAQFATGRTEHRAEAGEPHRVEHRVGVGCFAIRLGWRTLPAAALPPEGDLGGRMLACPGEGPPLRASSRPTRSVVRNTGYEPEYDAARGRSRTTPTVYRPNLPVVLAQTGRTFSACGPFWPCVISNSTRWFSSSER